MTTKAFLDTTIKEAPTLSKNEMESFEKLVAPQAAPRTYELIYPNIIFFAYIYVAAGYSLWSCLPSASRSTIIYFFFVVIASNLGITAGAHRLWTHKSYKAKLPLQIILIILNSLSAQFSAIKWVRDHRMHHKYSDTDADPNNPTRGIFFAHVGWAMVKKHEDFKKRVKTLDMSDLYSNPLLVFQYKYAGPVLMTAGFIIPTIVPVYFWNESVYIAWHMNTLRYFININCAGLVNSVTHCYGYRPYDKHIAPSQSNFVSIIALGEGFHNYHHTFPTDYRTAELGNNNLNITTKFIDFFAWIGWAYDLKTAPDQVIAARCLRTGDGTDLWGKDKVLKSSVIRNVGE